MINIKIKTYKNTVQIRDLQNRSRFNKEDTKTMGISLSKEQHSVLKEYSKLKRASISKLIIDSLDFNTMKLELSND